MFNEIDILSRKDKQQLIKIRNNITSFKDLISEQEYQKFFKSNFSFCIRNEFTHNIGWWLLTRRNIYILSEIFDNKKILSIGAGMGYGEKWTEKINNSIKFIITDKGKSGYFNHTLPLWVKRIEGLKALKKYQKQVDMIFLAWPPYNSNLAFNILKNLEYDKPLVVIGEGLGGCVANDDFWEEIEDDKKYKVKEIFDFDSFNGINDYITIIEKIKIH